MNRLIAIASMLALTLLIGCGDDDGDGPTGGTKLTRMEIRTDLTAPTMSSVDEAVWDQVTPKALDISNTHTPPVNSAKPLALSDSVYVQGIAAGGKLFLRLEWDDGDYSIKRDQWLLYDASGMNFNHYVGVYKEDQVFVMFEMPDDEGWDTWNWRSLTTGQSGCAEGMTYADSALTVDADNGLYQLVWENYNGFDNTRPIWVHKDEYNFVGDIMYIDDTLGINATIGDPHWDADMTVPGWILLDSVLPAAMRSQSRWDITAIHSFDAGHYKLVLSRPLTSGSDDLDMSSLTEVKARIGVLDDMYADENGSTNAFTEDFMMDF